MGTKYYTRFLLQPGETGQANEYSGVVELQVTAQHVLQAGEIEALLAKSFDIDSGQVELLNWDRLH
jgi:hypothetical protein